MHKQKITPSGRTAYLLLAAQDMAWLLLVVLTPLWVNLWGAQPFELPKTMLARTLIWLLAALALAEALPALRPRRPAPRHPLAWPLGLLAAVVLVTTVTAADWRLSLWGSHERGQGALTMLSYLLLCALAATHFGNVSRTKTVIVAMAATAAPIVLLGTVQLLGWNPLGLVSDARSPVYATLGRSNFVGAYLALLTPLTAALLVTSAARMRRALWGILLAWLLVLVGLTLSRSAWLAAAIALLLFVLLWQWPRLTRTARWGGVGAAAALVVSGPLAVLALGPRDLGSIAARATIWEATARLIAERPLLGYGADALVVTFGRVFPPQLVYLQGRDLFVDRAHNLFLDWLLATGVPGLLAYLLVLAAFVVTVGRALLRPAAPPLAPQRRVLLAAILAAVAGNLTNTMVSFDVTPTATATWLLIGMGAGLAAPRMERPILALGRRSQAITAVLLAATLLAAWQFNGRPLMADVAARTAQRHMLRGEWEHAAVQAQRAVAYWPVEPEHRLLLGAASARLAAADPLRAGEAWAQAERAFAEATALRPDDARAWLFVAEFYAAAERSTGARASARAVDAYGRALDLAPNDAASHAALGAYYASHNDPVRAAEALRRAVALDATHGEAYLHLASAEMALGRVEVALADYQEAARWLKNPARAYAGIAECYSRLGRTDDATQAMEEARRHAARDAHIAALHGDPVPAGEQ